MGAICHELDKSPRGKACRRIVAESSQHDDGIGKTQSCTEMLTSLQSARTTKNAASRGKRRFV
jgi:hypothetical protein